VPRTPIVDFSKVNIEMTQFDQEEIKKQIPHRFEMLQIDRIIHFDPEAGLTVGCKTLNDDEFWIRGHIPGRPILPGVLLLEASAQLCTFHFRKTQEIFPGGFFGFVKVENMKFRGVAEPGDMIIFATELRGIRHGRAKYAAQAFVDGAMIFEAEITGAAV